MRIEVRVVLRGEDLPEDWVDRLTMGFTGISQAIGFDSVSLSSDWVPDPFTTGDLPEDAPLMDYAPEGYGPPKEDDS